MSALHTLCCLVVGSIALGACQSRFQRSAQNPAVTGAQPDTLGLERPSDAGRGVPMATSPGASGYTRQPDIGAPTR